MTQNNINHRCTQINADYLQVNTDIYFFNHQHPSASPHFEVRRILADSCSGAGGYYLTYYHLTNYHLL